MEHRKLAEAERNSMRNESMESFFVHTGPGGGGGGIKSRVDWKDIVRS